MKNYILMFSISLLGASIIYLLIKEKGILEYQDYTEWHSCVLFGKRAEFAGEYLKKGQLVYLEGRLQTRSWEDDSGTKKYKTEVIGNEITMLGKKVGTGGSSQEGNNASDDDLPF